MYSYKMSQIHSNCCQRLCLKPSKGLNQLYLILYKYCFLRMVYHKSQPSLSKLIFIHLPLILGTPINKAPTVGNRDLNLHKLFRVVQHLGGWNKVG